MLYIVKCCRYAAGGPAIVIQYSLGQSDIVGRIGELSLVWLSSLQVDPPVGNLAIVISTITGKFISFIKIVHLDMH